MRRTVLASLGGAAILAAFSIAALPFSRGLFRAPRTPYGDSADWVLLQGAGHLIPTGSSVLVRAEPPDAEKDSYLHRYGVALLPGRKVVPAALWSVPTPPDIQLGAEYEIVVGARPETPPGELLLQVPEGTVWRRAR